MEILQDKTYSISQASQALGKSESSIKTYKKLVMLTFQKDISRVVEGNGSLTEFGFHQLSKAAHFIAKGNAQGYMKAVFQSFPELEIPLGAPCQPPQSTSGSAHYTSPLKGGSLVERRSVAITNAFSTFDQAEADGELALIKQDIAEQVENLDGVFSRYARAKVKQALTDIDHTVETLKANALSEMGVTATAPKPAPPNGTAA